ncbi:MULTISPECIES: DUF4272 domain-containing protein [unclassified Variovorax]|uniref:DUF4272 domain-containing protein n=1 Tax=unclassified Variovorax TaxID=663243 RepID=UPI0008D553EC|nr:MULTISPECIES: DUF4272 domain-containing protein [unclassified Variovorax]SEK03068.1 protein of unknown function [Variovorax sp. OK202]SFD35698.1 protein of unknown function [Variovorax sp. OK212]
MKGLLTRLRGLGASAKPAQPPGERVDDQGGEGVLINAYCTRADVPALDFAHTLLARRDLSDAELATHLSGFVGYVLSRGNGEMSRNRYHVMRHIQRVRQHLSLSIDESQLDAFSAWAERANAIVFLPDGGIRDPHGRVLLSAAGEEPDREAALPYPPEAWQRKARTEALLAARGMPVPQHLPPLISEPELRLRAPEDLTGRAFALLAVSARAESVANNEPLAVGELLERLPSAQASLTPKEQAFLSDGAPAESTVVQFGWRFECLFVLEWAMGLVDALPFPEAICDVPLATRTMLEARDVTGAMRAAQIRAEVRTESEILDALDLHYRLHWLIRQARMKEAALPQGLDAGVVAERHHALNWLVRFEDHEWDDVDTPT